MVDKQRIWCGICGTYVYDGDTLPCETSFEYDTGRIIEGCGVLGRQAETMYEEQLDLFAAQKQHHQNGPIATGWTEEAQARGAPKALDSQVGGSHYSKLKIQPFEYSLGNNLGPAEHTAIKYVTRWKDKGGVKDLDKAIHTLQILKEWAVNNGFS